jgi:antitoxin VapB
MEVVDPMPETGIAKLFRNGRSQAVRLPREFRFEGNQVRVRRLADGVLLEPLIADPADWFAAMDQVREGLFPGKGRKQPATPRREIFK